MAFKEPGVSLPFVNNTQANRLSNMEQNYTYTAERIILAVHKKENEKLT